MANTVHKIIRFLRKNLTNSSYNEALSAVNEKVGSGLEAGEPVIAFYQNGDTKGVVMGISDGANSGNGFTFHNAEIIESKLSTKVDKTAGQGLSTNDYSNDEKKKVNSSIKSISTTGGSNSSTTTFTKNDSSTIKNTVSGNGVTVSVTGTNGEYITTLGVASATTNTIGGIKVGYIQNNKNYPVLLDSSSEKAYVNVPWENNTHYASNSILADSNTATANTTTDLTNGKVRINHIENGKVTSSAIIKGTGSTIVTASTDGTITISSSTPDLSTYATQTWVTDKGYTANKGTVTSVAVKMNGNVKGTITSSGTIDLGNVITDISGKSDTGHTHTTSLAETTNTANITFEHGKNYQITAGGTSGIFKMPSLPTADSNTSGVMKLYTITGDTNDGAMSQSAVTTALAGKSDTIHKHTKSDITDFPSSLPANGGNADTVDNKHAADFASSSHTHTTSIASATSSSNISLIHGGNYQLSAGSTSTIFTMPSETVLTTASTGNGNAITSLSVSGHKITVAKDNTFSLNGHTHTTTITSTTNAASITFEHGKNYQITAGGTSGIFKMPSETTLSKGTTTGGGNAVTDISVNGHTVTLTKGATYIPLSDKGAASGVAPLNANSKIDSTYLPSYVDDVLEYSGKTNFPTTGETGKIYVDIATNLTYRWGGSAYVEISPSLALGTTSSTAFAGDKGQTAYSHSQITSGNPHKVTKSDLGLGNVDNTADANKSVKYATTAGSANAVTWGNVTGKPSTFTPASHTHEYLPLSGGTVSGDVTFKDSKVVQLNTLKVPTAAGGSTYGAGTNGQVLKTNGTTVYWGSDNNTDTHYESKNIVGGTSTATTETTGLTNGNVYLNHIENGAKTSSHNIKGSGATTVTTDANGAIIIKSTDTDTKYTHPTHTAYSSGLYKISTNSLGHVTAATAVQKSDITNLGIPGSDTQYTHPTTSGNKHIPSGGSSGQILRWSADGTAVWGSDSDTHYESKTVVNNTTASTANTTTALANGMVYLNHVENGSVKTSHSISGGGATTVTTNEKGDIVISSTDTNTDTKNTAGSTNTSSKIFLIGATSQATNPQTYSHDTCYVGTDGCLYSNNTKVITSIPTATTTSLGAVKVGSNITVNSGTISVSKSNVTNALGYTPSNVITIIDLT